MPSTYHGPGAFPGDICGLVNLYRQRMQIEESFRDIKSQQFGEGLERSRSNVSGRFTLLVLIVLLAAFPV